MNNKSNYMKKENNRKIFRFSEYNILNVSWVASLALFLVIFSGTFDLEAGGIASPGGFYFALSYLAAAVFAFLLSLKMRSDIIKNNQVSDFVRKSGFLLILFIFTGNLFVAIAGFSMVKRNRSLEYTLAFYAFINTILIIMVSGINLFKAYVANNFLLGIYLLTGLAAFYLLTVVLTHFWIIPNKKYKNLLVPAIVCLMSGVSGNLFGFCLGLVILSKIKTMDQNRTVEWIDVMHRVFRNYMSAIGLFVVIFLLSLSICSYLTFDYSIAIDNDYAAILRHPSLMYPFGTDEFGRCVFTRIVFGARISLIIGLISTILPFIIGGLLGAVAGHYGGAADNIVMRCLDVLYAVPSILLAIAIVAAFGASTQNLIIALSVGMIPVYARTMRAQVMIVTSNEFVEAARSCGRKEYQIVLRHIIPNALAPMIVRATLSIGGAVLSVSSLSFLGLGVEPHIPEWGSILKAGSQYLETNPYLAIYPGLAIILIVLAFNYFGDGLRDALDPKLR